MKKIFTLLLLVIVTFSFTACYEQVPAGTKGKILGKTGWQPEVIPPSKIWVETTFTTVPEQLFLIETTTQKFVQPIKVLLSDKLTLNAEIVFRGRVTSNQKVINGLFNDMPMNDNIVTTKEVYETYGKMIVLNTAREVISKYNIDEVNKNYARITTELYKAIAPKLKNLPIDISDVTIGNIKYPQIVTDAINAAKKRRMEIETEKAQVQIALTKKAGEEQLAVADYRIKMMEAKRIRDYNKMTAQGITKDLLKLRELELRELELNKWNGVLPTTLMGASNVPVIINTK